MVQVTDTMGKSNPHGLTRLLVVVVSHLNEPGVEEVAGLSESKALWKESTELHWISANPQSMLSEKIGFPVGNDLLSLLLLKGHRPFAALSMTIFSLILCLI